LINQPLLSFVSLLLASFALSVANLPVKAQSSTLMIPSLLAQSGKATQDEAIEKKAEAVINLLAKQDYTKARTELAPQLQALWPPEKIKQVWEKQIIGVQGDFKQILKSETIDIVDGKLVIVTIKFAKQDANLVVTFNEKQEIIGLDFPEAAKVEEIAENFVNALISKNYATARGYLSPLLKIEFFPEKVQTRWEQLLKQTGAVKKIIGIQVNRGDQPQKLDVVSVTIEFKKVTEDLIIIFDADKQIVGVNFPEI
jgi:hypothetical protein